MRLDDLDGVIRDTLRREAAASAYRVDGLEDRIAATLAGRLPKQGLRGTARQLLSPRRGVRTTQLVVLAATAACFLLMGAVIAPRLGFVSPADGTTQLRSMLDAPSSATLFVVPAPGAETVAVLGNFNEWTAMPLVDPDDDGIWTASLDLPPGRYEYAFLVDGRWWGQDPLADEYVRSFGEYNSVRYVGRPGEGA